MCTSTTRHSSFSKLKHKIHNKQAWHSQKAFFFYSFSFGSQCLHPSRPKYSNFLTTFRPELCSVEHWEEFLGSSCPCCCCVNHSYSLLNATYFQSCLQILFVSRQLNEKQPAVGMEGWRGRLTEGQRNVIIRIRHGNCMWLCYLSCTMPRKHDDAKWKQLNQQIQKFGSHRYGRVCDCCIEALFGN